MSVNALLYRQHQLSGHNYTALGSKHQQETPTLHGVEEACQAHLLTQRHLSICVTVFAPPHPGHT